MKALLASAFLLAATSSSMAAVTETAHSDVCARFMTCGTFQGSGANFQADGTAIEGGDYLEKLIITPVNATTVTIENFVYDKTHQPEDDYVLRLNLEFGEDGQFTAQKAGRLFATGVCRNLVCSFNFVPWKNSKGTVSGNVNIFRFEGNKLKRQMMSSIDFDDVGYQRSELTRK